MLAIDQTYLFTDISNQESAIVAGGIRGRQRNWNSSIDSIIVDVNLAQMIFALGAYQFTLMLTGNTELANSVLTTQWNRAFRSFF